MPNSKNDGPIVRRDWLRWRDFVTSIWWGGWCWKMRSILVSSSSCALESCFLFICMADAIVIITYYLLQTQHLTTRVQYTILSFNLRHWSTSNHRWIRQLHIFHNLAREETFQRLARRRSLQRSSRRYLPLCICHHHGRIGHGTKMCTQTGLLQWIASPKYRSRLYSRNSQRLEKCQCRRTEYITCRMLCGMQSILRPALQRHRSRTTLAHLTSCWTAWRNNLHKRGSLNGQKFKVVLSKIKS